jgi:hypothetical protein
MPSENSANPKVEIRHVLSIDINGYSKLLIHEQSERQRQLNQIVRNTEQFRSENGSGRVTIIPFISVKKTKLQLRDNAARR